MEHTSCREDRIHHALNRCLHDLSSAPSAVHSGNAGLSMNHWTLEELVKRDPENFLILLKQILRRAKEVQDQCQYELVAPLALIFSSALLRTPFLPPHCPLLAHACEVFSGFLSWPEPYGGVCRDLLTVLRLELRAPGISYHRLVREEQGISAAGYRSKTLTVLLMDPADVPQEFLSVSEQMSGLHQAQQDVHITLIKHAYQAGLGPQRPLSALHHALQSKSPEQLEQLSCAVTEVLEACASMEEPEEARGCLVRGLEDLWETIGVQASDSGGSDGVLQTLALPIAKFHLHLWDNDNFDSLPDLLEREGILTSTPTPPEEEEKEEEEEVAEDEEDGDERQEIGEDIEEEAASDIWAGHRDSTLSTTSKDSMFSTSSAASSSSCSAPSRWSGVSGADSDFCEDAEDSPPERSAPPRPRLGRHLSKLLKSRKRGGGGGGGGGRPLSRANSLGSPETKGHAEKRHARFARSNSLRQKARSGAGLGVAPPLLHLLPAPPPLRLACSRRIPVLSCGGAGRGWEEEEEEEEGRGCGSTLRLVVFGGDRAAGKAARACARLTARDGVLPARVQLFFVPVARGFGRAPAEGPGTPEKQPESPPRAAARTDVATPGVDDITNDIAQFLGTLDPWYERNVLSFLDLPVGVLCQQTPKAETDVHSSSREPLPIFADLLLHYCRQGKQPILVQLYQAELTLAGGERRTEVFVHSLELGHTAGTRAIKAAGAASKRFGVVGDREAVPLTLEILYNQVTVSRRSRWTQADVVCTSINLSKACKSLEDQGSNTERLQMAVTEVRKRQNSKSKMGYNQHLSTTEVKVDHVQVSSASSTTFAVCLDQDEKKVLQSVTRCEVSVCTRPDGSEWGLRTDPLEQTPGPPLLPPDATCSQVCLPLLSFCGTRP
ncbi:phosphoinositide 3-kinase regulatory subunit 5-like [Anguilla anguilla]|uniref:phosphoinositide 3-kinase regulatory subunit 5-like n=1 Tax=Anguilla anguilla TaxID=7936 RepID=UPI0015AB3F50|nr:phosphoinositide 3-kinase regulatory subunit 5-like [Anguilla anguilla]XP_035252971.1 phosphoinositide 3-kinase regulatory subunit 5-like [Anguilla anguilla]